MNSVIEYVLTLLYFILYLFMLAYPIIIMQIRVIRNRKSDNVSVKMKRGYLSFYVCSPIIFLLSLFLWPISPDTASKGFIYNVIHNLFQVINAIFAGDARLIANGTAFTVCKCFVISEQFVNMSIWLLYIILPLLTLSALIVLMRDPWTQLIYRCNFWRQSHVFSSLNDKSMHLAKSILQNVNAKFYQVPPLIMFCDVCDDDNVDSPDSYYKAAKDMGALLTKRHIGGFNITRRSTVYFIGEDEEMNVTEAIRVTKSDIFSASYVFSNNSSAEPLINSYNQDAKERKEIPISLISESQVIAYDLLFRYPLFIAKKESDERFTLMIIGCGRIGKEIAKAAAFAGQAFSNGIKIIVADSNQSAKELFESGCRGVCDTLKDSEYGYNVDIEFVTECVVNGETIPFDANTISLNGLFEKYPDVNYIVVSPGNDELAMNSAIYARRHYERMRTESVTDYKSADSMYSPVIVAIIRDENNFREVLRFSETKTSYNIIPFGNNGCIFDYKITHDWYIEHMAKYANWVYLFRRAEIAKNPDNHYLPYPDEEIAKRVLEANKVRATEKAIKRYIKKKKVDSDKAYSYLPEVEKESNRAVSLHTIYKLIVAEETNMNMMITSEFEWMKNIDFLKRLSAMQKLISNNSEKRDYFAALEHQRWCVLYLLHGYTHHDELTKEQRSRMFDIDRLGDRERKNPIARIHLNLKPYKYIDKNTRRNDYILNDALYEMLNDGLDIEKRIQHHNAMTATKRKPPHVDTALKK